MEFKTEAELCQAFIDSVPEEWVVYPESCGFDILLSHKETGHQIGIEAKLRLNTKVLIQALPSFNYITDGGPDFRAILVPYGKKNDVAELAQHLGITVFHMRTVMKYDRSYGNFERIFSHFELNPDFPDFITLETRKGWYWHNEQWFDLCPVERCSLPEVVPDVACGVPAPLRLTEWKIKAIKLLIVLDKFGTVTRTDFKDLNLNQSLWTQSRWLTPAGTRGHWKRCENTPDLRKEHPVNFEQIEAMYDDWLPKNRKAV